MANPFRRPAHSLVRFFSVLLLAGAAWADSAREPATGLLPLEAEYRVIVNGMQARAKRNLIPGDGNRWRVESDSSLLFFKIVERSEFKLEANGVVPLTYFHDRTGGGDRNQNVTFDWHNGIARNQRRVGSWEYPLAASEPLWDKLSLQVQLRDDLLTGRFKSGNGYDVLDRGEKKTYLIEKLGEETIALPSGTRVATVKLRQFREGKDRYTMVWLAPEHNYLIVRLEHHDDGETNSMRLVRARVGEHTLQ